MFLLVTALVTLSAPASDDEGSTAATDGSTLRTSPADHGGSVGSESGGSAVDSVAGEHSGNTGGSVGLGGTTQLCFLKQKELLLTFSVGLCKCYQNASKFLVLQGSAFSSSVHWKARLASVSLYIFNIDCVVRREGIS